MYWSLVTQLDIVQSNIRLGTIYLMCNSAELCDGISPLSSA